MRSAKIFLMCFLSLYFSFLFQTKEVSSNPNVPQKRMNKVEEEVPERKNNSQNSLLSSNSTSESEIGRILASPKFFGLLLSSLGLVLFKSPSEYDFTQIDETLHNKRIILKQEMNSFNKNIEFLKTEMEGFLSNPVLTEFNSPNILFEQKFNKYVDKIYSKIYKEENED